MSDKLPPARMIESLAELEHFSKELKTEKSVAVDIESDGFFVYREKVCLLQLTTSAGDFIVDPLAVKDLSPLGPLFRNPKIEKLFHAGEYDVVCLKRDYGFQIRNVFDTMIASRILGEERLGLARLIEKHFKIKLSKKLQRANWGKRPLTPEMCKYARLDTHYLHALRDILRQELEQKDMIQDAQDAFARLERTEPQERVFDPEDFWHIKGARELAPQKRAVLKALYLYREKKSAALDRAPFRVLSEQLLVRIAEKSPKTEESLKEMKGMTPYLFSHFGRDVARSVAEGLAAAPIEKPPERNHQNRWDSGTMRRYEALRAWRKNLAAERGVNPVVILATDEIRSVSQAPRDNPSEESWLDSLSEHKRSSYGKAILEVLSRPIPSKKRRRRRSRNQDAKKVADK